MMHALSRLLVKGEVWRDASLRFCLKFLRVCVLFYSLSYSHFHLAFALTKSLLFLPSSSFLIHLLHFLLIFFLSLLLFLFFLFPLLFHLLFRFSSPFSIFSFAGSEAAETPLVEDSPLPLFPLHSAYSLFYVHLSLFISFLLVLSFRISFCCCLLFLLVCLTSFFS